MMGVGRVCKYSIPCSVFARTGRRGPGRGGVRVSHPHMHTSVAGARAAAIVPAPPQALDRLVARRSGPSACNGPPTPLPPTSLKKSTRARQRKAHVHTHAHAYTHSRAHAHTGTHIQHAWALAYSPVQCRWRWPCAAPAAAVLDSSARPASPCAGCPAGLPAQGPQRASRFSQRPAACERASCSTITKTSETQAAVQAG